MLDDSRFERFFFAEFSISSLFGMKVAFSFLSFFLRRLQLSVPVFASFFASLRCQFFFAFDARFRWLIFSQLRLIDNRYYIAATGADRPPPLAG